MRRITHISALAVIFLWGTVYSKKGYFMVPDLDPERYDKVKVQEEVFYDKSIKSEAAWDAILNNVRAIADSIANVYDYSFKKTAKRLYGGNMELHHCQFVILDESYIEEDYHNKYFVEKKYFKRVAEDGYYIYVHPGFFKKYGMTKFYQFAMDEITLQMKYFKIARQKMGNDDVNATDVVKRLTIGYAARVTPLINVFHLQSEDVQMQWLLQELGDFYIELSYLHGISA